MADRRRRRKGDGSEESEEFSDSSDEDTTVNKTTSDLDTTTELPNKEPVSIQGESEYESVEEDEGVVETKEKIRDVPVNDGAVPDASDNPAEEEGGEEGTADMLEGDCLDDDEDWKEEQREEGDGEESENLNKEKVLDFDEDRRNPQYIPKKGGFYEHDDRLTEEATVVAVEVEEKAKKGKKKLWKDEGKWMHDRYQDGEQNPKSHEELVTVYGYDIRNEDGPPRARRRRRYGRGPSKYTRKWDDEDAYAKILPSRGSHEDGGTPDSMNGPRGGGGGRGAYRGPRRGVRGYRGGGGLHHHDREFTEDEEDAGEVDRKESHRHERVSVDPKEWPALDEGRPADERGDADDRPPVNRNRQHQRRDDRDDRHHQQQQPRPGSREQPAENDSSEHRYRRPANLEQGPPPVRDRRDNYNSSDAFVPRRGRGARGGRGAPRGNYTQATRARGYNSREQRPADDTVRDHDREYDAGEAPEKNLAPDRAVVQQMEALDIKSTNEGDNSGGDGFSPPKESRSETKSSPSQHGGQHERRQASIPPRLQDTMNRPKRYSSQRQRPVPENVSYPVSPAPHGAPATIPPRFYDQGYQQQPIYPDHGTPAGVPQGAGGVLIPPQPYPFDPSYQDAYVARSMPNPQRIYPPLSLAAGQPVTPAPYIAPAGNMMNYGPPPVTYQQIPYQQYAVPQPPPQVVSVQGDPLKSTLTALQPQPHEIFRGGMAYYNAQPQVVRTLPKRPRAAIPIVPPPEMHMREDYEDMRDSGDVESPVEDSPNESQSHVGDAEQ